MHVLDLIMYFVCLRVLWFLLDVTYKGDYKGECTREMVELGIEGFEGRLIPPFLLIVYKLNCRAWRLFLFTIIYIIIFWFCDYNWVDINTINWSSYRFKW